MKKLCLSVMTALCLTGSTFAATQTVTNPKDLSYALGYQFGSMINHFHSSLEVSSYEKGLKAGLAGTPSRLNANQMKSLIMHFQMQLQSQGQKMMHEQGAKNQIASEKFLANNKTQKGVITLPNGLQYKILEVGHGKKPTAKDTVTVDYEGKLIDGKVFDSSYKRGKPATFPLNGVIPGWTQALQLMPVGSTWELFIPANLAYGSRGVPGIGPNQALIFKVHLISIK